MGDATRQLQTDAIARDCGSNGGARAMLSDQLKDMWSKVVFFLQDLKLYYQNMGISSQEYRIRSGVFISRNHKTFKTKSENSNLCRNRAFSHSRINLFRYSKM